MSKQKEKWDLYSIADDTFVKTVTRGYWIPNDLYHLAVEVIPTDGKGHLLLTRRALTKYSGAGMYEFPAGSVISGETPLDAAKRELHEETGLTCNHMELIASPVIPGLKRMIYLAIIPDLLNKEIRLQESETAGYCFVTVKEWYELIRKGKVDSSRLSMYTRQVYTQIEQNCGIPEEDNPNKETRTLHIAEILFPVNNSHPISHILWDDDEESDTQSTEDLEVNYGV